jgi:hypothetical protein
MFKVETNIPLPECVPRGRGFYSKFPIKHMKVGDSFFAAGYTPQTIAGALDHAAKRLAAHQGGTKQRYVKRQETVAGVKGTRVWRRAVPEGEALYQLLHSTPPYYSSDCGQHGMQLLCQWEYKGQPRMKLGMTTAERGKRRYYTLIKTDLMLKGYK